MFRFFENLINPYCDYPETDVPPTRLWPFMREYARPFRSVFWMAGLMSIVVAAIEVGLISYMGHCASQSYTNATDERVTADIAQ